MNILQVHNADDRLWQLVADLCDGSITSSDFADLETRLREDEEARLFFAAYTDLHGRLLWRFRSGGQDEESGVREDGLEVSEPPLSVPPLFTTHYPLPTNFIGGPVFSYMVASVVLCLMLLGAWAYKITHDRNVVASNSRRSTTSGPLNQPNMIFVGRITGMKDCRWADPNTQTVVGASVALDRRYALASGLLEITYKSGARVILEGPCTYRVGSSAGGFLERGKLTANISSQKSPNPQSPIPNPFIVRTPTAVVTDLGTEFGVEVDENGDTLSHVFQGIVKVQGLAASATGGPAPMETILRVNESARVVKDVAGPRFLLGNEARNIPRFVQKMPDLSSADQTFAIDGRVFQDDFDGKSIDVKKWIVNATEGGSAVVADGVASVSSAADQSKGFAFFRSAVRLDFGSVRDDWWIEVKFKMEGDLKSGYEFIRDWIIIAGISDCFDSWEIQGFDLRAMQQGVVDSDSFDLGWFGWDNVDQDRTPVAIARDLKKGRFYTAAIHRKPDNTADIYLDGRMIATKPLIALRNPTYLQIGDLSKYVQGRQVIDCVKMGTAAIEHSTEAVEK